MHKIASVSLAQAGATPLGERPDYDDLTGATADARLAAVQRSTTLN